MRTRFTVGQHVQTRFGKGQVREVRNSGRLLVHVRGHSLLLNADDLAPVDPDRTASTAGILVRGNPATDSRQGSAPRTASSTVDLHGYSVPDALARVEQALNDAILADLSELRVVHGRSGGRIRTALHEWLRHEPGVRGFEVDPQNAGVTIIRL